MSRLLPVLGLAASLAVLGVQAQDLPSDIGCVGTCYGTVSSDFTAYNCASGADWTCLCKSNNFRNGVRDCAVNGCGATADQAFIWLDTTSSCSSVTPVDESDDNDSTTSSAAPTSTAAAEETSAAAPTSAEPTPTPTETAAGASTTAPANDATATSDPTSGTENGAAPKPTSTSTKDTQDDDDEDPVGDSDDGGGGGLSQGAAVGIGVGVAVCVVAVAIVALVIFLRYRKKSPQGEPRPDIAGPMSSGISGSYPAPENGQYGEKGSGDSIEMTANRYEDMPPRQTPRTMV